jgi:hypothetical protein
MKIAIATDNYTRVAGHAGKARHWLLYLHLLVLEFP